MLVGPYLVSRKALIELIVAAIQNCVMSYSHTFRSELKRDGYLVEERLEEKRFKIRASKGAEVFVGEADTEALAFLDLSLGMREGAECRKSYRRTSISEMRRTSRTE